MNNGKVRIYELSRELNLENKDILAVCEQLNIAVKSHSSTISEDEADRIRAYSDKYVAAHPEAKTSGSGKGHRSKATAESGGSAEGKKKQQILEIRKHKSSGDKNQRAETSSADETPPPAPQPPSPPSPSEVTTFDRPVYAKPSETSPQEDVHQPSEPSPEELPALQKPQLASTETDDTESGSQATTSSEVESPQLKRPPTRPNPPTTASDSTSAPLKEKPILKKPKGDGAGSPSSPKKSDEAIPGKEREAPAASAESSGDRAPKQVKRKPESVPELQRPRPSKGKGDEEVAASGDRPGAGRSFDEETSVDEEIETEGLKLKRPTPPRPPKRSKKYEEEEEDIQEFPAKTSKTGSKSKRRAKPIDDEDEEELDLDNDKQSAAIDVSLSTARPNKPKTSQGPRQGTSGPSSAPKNKKSSPTRDSGSRHRGRRQDKAEKKQRPEHLVLRQALTVRELATELETAETEIVKILFFKGIAVNVTQTLDIPTAKMVAEELGVEVETAEAESEAKKVSEMLDADDLENLQSRPPVVTIMGHVDHGKTTLLDAIRKTKVAQGEAGGITQHIGAYHVDVEHNDAIHQIVFLDTPGHEAFTAMRARGTRVTDIAVLVVAADDGVQPQTLEAIGHARAAEVPLVVAINKIDKEGAQSDRVKQELSEHGLVPEEWGGDTIMVPLSAIKGENLDTLLEMIVLVAEIEELMANPDRPAKGTVIEANLDKAKGPVATLLVQNGTLRVGDILVAGSAMGKVRAMVDDRGQRVEAASPSFAVEVLGLGDVPAAGDEFEVFGNEKEARAVADSRAEESRQSRLQQAMASRRVTLNSLSARAQEGELKELNLILKADVQGSVEAILGSLRQLPQNEVQVRVLLSAPGEISETDVDLAAASDAVIIGFNTTLATGARQAADRSGVDIREYNIIYKLLDDIQGAMEGLLEPEMVEEAIGEAEVRAVFPVGRGAVAGCYIQNGKMIRNAKVRVRRQNQVIYEGVLDSLKRVKDDVKEANSGFECGIGIDRFSDWEEGDIIEAYRLVAKRRTLSPN
ncbi:MAG: translation initiation factor IF-2 [Cyanobacteria bacterium J007]|nr:MAG: translation initiation factor IF-2 [Cyanobacteria bacterium J007]